MSSSVVPMSTQDTYKVTCHESRSCSPSVGSTSEILTASATAQRSAQRHFSAPAHDFICTRRSVTIYRPLHLICVLCVALRGLSVFGLHLNVTSVSPTPFVCGDRRASAGLMQTDKCKAEQQLRVALRVYLGPAEY